MISLDRTPLWPPATGSPVVSAVRWPFGSPALNYRTGQKLQRSTPVFGPQVILGFSTEARLLANLMVHEARGRQMGYRYKPLFEHAFVLAISQLDIRTWPWIRTLSAPTIILPMKRVGYVFLTILACIFVERVQHPFNLYPPTYGQMPFPQNAFQSALPFPSADSLYMYEALRMEMELKAAQSPDPAERQKICTVCSAFSFPSTPPPPPQAITFPPPNWLKIPQQPYKQKHWAYKPLPPILFQVHGHPGMNLGDALLNKFAVLEGRDDLVLQAVGTAFMCRLLVRPSR